MQRAFARHLRDVEAHLPGCYFPRVVMTVDNATWHRGKRVEAALATVLHVQLYRLPSYSPHLNVVERLWKLLRQRATHNRLFDSVEELLRTVRKHLDWLQIDRSPVRSLIGAQG